MGKAEARVEMDVLSVVKYVDPCEGDRRCRIGECMNNIPIVRTGSGTGPHEVRVAAVAYEVRVFSLEECI
jgi:hypothetical protein